MALVGWNLADADQALARGNLSKAGVIIHIRDKPEADAPHRADAVREGLIPSDAIDPPAPEAGG